MEFLPTELEKYVTGHTRPESDLLQKLNRETHAKVLKPRMLSGHLQGQVLRMFSYMIRPKNILEIGTFTGYSALCLCEGLQDDGKLITIDINEELEPMVRRYFSESGKDARIDYRVGNALEIIPGLNQSFDLVFIDADKVNYARYYEMVMPMLRPGGFIIADNVLWSGKVLDPLTNKDEDTRAICAFNEHVANDSRVETVLFPIRDGLMVIRKK
ncbi:MAG: O-methyltransferase family 3 [Bacteroidetes bacterium]|nr:MAG: O-methyltransferase family 3 [Bacteroidota bacterium]